MTQSKELKQVRDETAVEMKRIHENIISKPTGIMIELYDFLEHVRAALDRLSAPVGVKKIEGLQEAWLLNTDPTLNRAKEMDFIRKYDATFQGVIDDAARAYLELQNAVSVGAPDGYKLVPVEPTDDMLNSGAYCSKYAGGKDDVLLTSIYQAMLSAAPTPATKLQKDVNLVDGVSDCKFETPAPTAVDLDKIKRDLLPSVCLIKKHSDIVSCIVDKLATQYDFVRKV